MLRRTRHLGTFVTRLSCTSGWTSGVSNQFPPRPTWVCSTQAVHTTSNSQSVWKGIKQTFRILWHRKKPRYVGTDQYGNRFFEAAPNIGSEHLHFSQRPKRFVLIPGQDSLDDPWMKLSGDLPKMSPEWASWLQLRRVDPPSPEEVAANAADAQRRAIAGLEFEAKYEAERSEMVRQGLLHDSTSPPHSQSVKGKEKVPFPERPDMELIPGENISQDPKYGQKSGN